MRKSQLSEGMEVAVKAGMWERRAVIVSINDFSRTKYWHGEQTTYTPGAGNGYIAVAIDVEGPWWRPAMIRPNNILKPWAEYAAEKEREKAATRAVIEKRTQNIERNTFRAADIREALNAYISVDALTEEDFKVTVSASVLEKLLGLQTDETA